jgi:type II secretory pathway component PulK
MNPPECQSQSLRPNRSEQGIVLVLVLLLLGLIITLAVAAQTAARLTLSLEEELAARCQLRAAAADAAWGALALLAGDANLQVDHTNEPWAEATERVLPGGLKTSVQVVDENRRFDVNSLSARLPNTAKRTAVDVVGDLLALAGEANPAFQSRVLQDWIDPDHQGVREADYYLGLNPPVAIADAFMESPQELAEVLTRAGALKGLPPSLTVLPARSARIMPVNLNTAAPEVIMAVLGPQNRAAAELICRLRDAAPLTSLEVLKRQLKTGAENPWAPFFAVNSSYFSVTACAVKDGRSEAVSALVFRDARGNVEILRWLCR